MPRKVFTAGEILTAADVNTNLMDQAVMVFDDSGARGSAIPSPSEGMITYLKDTDEVEKYDGTSFVGVATAPAILQVVNVVKTDAQTGNVASGASVTITSFSPSITPISASSTLLHFVEIGTLEQGATVRITGGVSIPVGDAAGSRERAVAGTRLTATRTGANVTFQFVDTPGSTSTLTYGLELVNANDITRPLHVNKGTLDTDVTYTSRTTSKWTIMEIAG